MRIQIHCVHFTADQSLLDFVQRKLNKLDTFNDRIVSGEVYLRLEGSETSRIKHKIVEVKLLLPGDSIFVQQQGTTFEEATDMVLDTLKNKLKRHKDKQRNISAQQIKESKELVEVGVVNDDIDF
ncbi:ribosome hibernation-promoting factor, HPF/YfiA family [Larkinella arboricola]|uniref:Putative sigma-54 modulation protein n=1 Tax=Larkinella arboricola TaxID=643671 RepID=A0A327X8G4_LARAB|nr:ribosome-associated translation inhibitor RaiA [Larkinella arboricola]RAK03215.1 putative sigma-54 modulation protein [Larkinella arboricola]